MEDRKAKQIRALRHEDTDDDDFDERDLQQALNSNDGIVAMLKTPAQSSDEEQEWNPVKMGMKFSDAIINPDKLNNAATPTENSFEALSGE